MSIGNKIVYEINRPDKKLVELFREMPVANIDDNMGRIAAVDAAIRPMNRSPLLGTAFTIRMPQGDNLMFHKAMDMALPGDVIMIDAGGSVDRAIVGELMVSYCRVRGIAGIVCDGAKSSCAAKIASAVDAAILGHFLGRKHHWFQPGEGIVQKDVEGTIKSMGYIGRVGMKDTDKQILNIMIDQVKVD